MASPFSRRLAGTVSLIALCSLGVLAAAEEPAAPAKVMGDLWEVTTQMSMEGMPMALPAQKAKVCTQKDWTEPPGAGDERRKCTNSDFKQDGPKVTWKTVCAGPPQMTGDGEVTRDGADTLDYLWRRNAYKDRAGGNPVLMLLDLKMPKVDGLEVLRQVKSSAQFKTIPIVILTSSREEQDVVRSYDLGVNAYVVKPVDFHDFIEAVKLLGGFWAVVNEPPPSR